MIRKLLVRNMKPLTMVVVVINFVAGGIAAQTASRAFGSVQSIDPGELRDKSYVNDELGLKMPLPPGVKVLMADGLAGASSRIADTLRTGEAKHDKRLELQGSTSRVLVKVDSQTPSTFLSISVSKDGGDEVKRLAASTHEVLLKSGQYASASPIAEMEISGQRAVFFTVKKVGREPVIFWRIYAFKRNGFQVSVGLVYLSDEGLNELEGIVKNIKFFSK